MFHPPPPGRALGGSFSFPVDPASRAFRRARSESSFPLDSLERSLTKLRFVPIQFKWRSVGDQKAPPEGDSSGKLVADRELVSLPVDPHKTGFGKHPVTTKVWSPPPCRIWKGVLGVDPGCRTRGNIMNNDEGVGNGAGIQPDVTIPLKRGDLDNPDPVRPSFDSSCIAKFVGYFHKSHHKSRPVSSTKSYAQVLQTQSLVMSHKGGFGGGGFGHGSGRDGARTNVWQQIQG